jgi:hypothetical protein
MELGRVRARSVRFRGIQRVLQRKRCGERRDRSTQNPRDGRGMHRRPSCELPLRHSTCVQSLANPRTKTRGIRFVGHVGQRSNCPDGSPSLWSLKRAPRKQWGSRALHACALARDSLARPCPSQAGRSGSIAVTSSGTSTVRELAAPRRGSARWPTAASRHAATVEPAARRAATAPGARADAHRAPGGCGRCPTPRGPGCRRRRRGA